MPTSSAAATSAQSSRLFRPQLKVPTVRSLFVSILAATLLIVAGWPGTAIADDSLESAELSQLRLYLAALKSGTPGRGESVDQLADVSFAGLMEVIAAYVELEQPVDPQTLRAFETLLERVSRTPLQPWPVVQLYSPELATFVTAPEESPLAQRLFERLRKSDGDRRTADLAVRLTPGLSLKHLASGQTEGRLAMLAAWNRRWSLGAERRPIPEMDLLVRKIAARFSLDGEPAERDALLQFMAHWPVLAPRYQECLKSCLESADPQLVQAALGVQQIAPALLELNEGLLKQFADHPMIVKAALMNYAFDAQHDHSALLRKIWGTLKPGDDPARVACLFSMGNHPRGNDAIALEAVIDQPFAFIDVAIPVLKSGDVERGRRAVKHVLTNSEQAHEEAFRLARALELGGFEKEALAAIRNEDADLALQTTAILYLRLADGQVRRQLLDLLQHPNSDLRLAAIQMFGEKRKLTEEDRGAIGPHLIRVALRDDSKGHRQEAIFSLAQWQEPLALDFFRLIQNQNPPIQLRRGYFANDDGYWQYRLRLVALLGLAKLKNREARDELLDMHRRGGPGERMDVLLALIDMGEASPVAFEDLNSPEPKLVATAAHLIFKFGDATERERARQFFGQTPLWLQFKDSGIDDNNLLRIGGLLETKP